MKRYLFLIILILFLSSAQVWAATYYVDTDSVGGAADDSNSGIITEPWLTIAQANSTLVAGDIVYIRVGTYTSDTINPSNSGTSGNCITYENYGSEVVTLSGGDYQANLNNKNYIIVDGLVFYNAGTRWAYFYQANHNIIQNCTFNTCYAYAGIRLESGGTGSDYNQFLNNTFLDAPNASDNTYPVDMFSIENGSYNLIQGNTFGNVSHTILYLDTSDTTYNVIRDNTFQNELHHNVTPYGNSHWNLFENNRFYDAGKDWTNNPCPYTAARDRDEHAGVQLGASNCIVRRNIFTNNGRSMTIGGYTSENNKVYHNTFYADQEGFYTNCTSIVENNVLKNNTFSNGVQYDIFYYQQLPSPGTNTWQYNNVYNGANNRYQTTVDSDIFVIQSAYPSEWSNTLSVNPLFTDAANRDFTLQSGSSLIDAGTWLTEVNDAGGGSGTSMIVDDAGYFYDGWGISGETADYIWVDNPSSADFLVQISSINYGTHTLTLASSQTWDDNADVYLAYSSTVGIMGAGVDIGAKEYDLVISDASPDQGNVGVSITIDLTWANPTAENTNDGYFKVGACPCDAGDSVWTNQAHKTSYDPGTLAYNTAHCWRVDLDHDGGTETGTNYGFTTTSQANPPTPEGSGMVYHKQGVKIVRHKKGLEIQ